ncbi:MAG: nucleotide sugar dehydrogenase [Nanoarchaeota archaeon]
MSNFYQLSKEELTKKLSSRDINVGVVGFGYIGCCIGAYMAGRGLKVTGIDTRDSIVESINKGNPVINEPGLEKLVSRTVKDGFLTATKDFSSLKNSDVILITVGTPLNDDFSPSMDEIKSASRYLGKYLSKGQMVMLKSTVPPFTTENVVRPILEEESGLRAGVDFGLAFSPERIAEGRALEELGSIPIVIGGYDKRSSEVASEFWKNIVGVETIIVSDTKTAEMTKLADNLWIDLNIALANELAQLSHKIGVDVLEVITAANSLPKVRGNVNILNPSMGVGGYCLTKDPWFVHNLGKQYGLDLKIPVTSRKVNDYMPKFTFDLIKECLEKSGKDIRESNVAVLGLSFKNSTGDVRYTPTKYAIEYLKDSGCNLRIFDPWVTKEETATVTNLSQSESLEAAIQGADAIAFFTGHPEFVEYPKAKIKTLVKKDCWIIDGRNAFNPKDMKDFGFNYVGIGR